MANAAQLITPVSAGRPRPASGPRVPAPYLSWQEADAEVSVSIATATSGRELAGTLALALAVYAGREVPGGLVTQADARLRTMDGGDGAEDAFAAKPSQRQKFRAAFAEFGLGSPL